MEKKLLTPAEYLAARSWTKFLESLSFGKLPWRIENYRDFISLRTIASILSKKEGATRKYSINQSKEDNTIFYIEVCPTNSQNQTEQG